MRLEPRIRRSIEVFFPSTEKLDHSEKFHRCVAWNLTLQDDVLVSQHEPKIERFSRLGEKWTYEYFSGLDATAEVPSIGCVLPFRDVYDRVEFADGR